MPASTRCRTSSASAQTVPRIRLYFARASSRRRRACASPPRGRRRARRGGSSPPSRGGPRASLTLSRGIGGRRASRSPPDRPSVPGAARSSASTILAARALGHGQTPPRRPPPALLRHAPPVILAARAEIASVARARLSGRLRLDEEDSLPALLAKGRPIVVPPPRTTTRRRLLRESLALERRSRGPRSVRIAVVDESSTRSATRPAPDLAPRPGGGGGGDRRAPLVGPSSGSARIPA